MTGSEQENGVTVTPNLDALTQRGLTPHIYDSAEEAHLHLADLGHRGA